MAKSFVLGLFLLVGLLSGLCLEPDSGTAAAISAQDVGAVLGPNHAKPLPRIPVPSDLLRPTLPALLIAVLALHRLLWAGLVCIESDGPQPRRLLRTRPGGLRGPPAPA